MHMGPYAMGWVGWVGQCGVVSRVDNAHAVAVAACNTERTKSITTEQSDSTLRHLTDV